MADEIPPLPLRRAGSRRGQEAPGRVMFRLPLPLRLTSLYREALLAVTFEGAPAGLRLTVEDAAGGVLFAATVEEVETLALLPLPKGAARIGIEGGGSDLAVGFLPVPDSFPLGRLVLKTHAFLHGRFDLPAGGHGLNTRWKAATDAARELRARLSTLLVNSSLGRHALRADYRRYRARFVEDFAAPVPAAAAPRLAFLTPLGADTPTLAELQNCATALRGQNDPHFEWVVAVPPARLAREQDQLRQLVAGLGRLVPQAGALQEIAPADLYAALDATGRPTRDAVALVRAAFAAHPHCALLYTDEERCATDGQPLEGVFKPAFNRHLLEAWPYFGALTVLKAAEAQALGLKGEEGAAAYELVLRHVAGLALHEILHLPRVAYSGPDRPAGFPDRAAAEHGAGMLAAHLGVTVEVSEDGRFLKPAFPLPPSPPKVSIVIPTRDRVQVMAMTLRTLIANTRYRNFEIVIVDNGSVEPETFALFEETKAAWPQTVIVRDDGDFNFPRICNAGVDAMSGELILLLNNDMEIIDGGWLDEMVALISRRDHQVDTGVVGAKLLFPDRTIQHAGVIAGLFRYAAHWFAHCPHWAEGYEGRLLVRQNLSAVTGACLLIRKDVWDAIGPLDAERFAEDCNDIDLCLRARRAGYGVVFTPFALLIHHESASRGRRRTAEHRARLKRQRARFDALWHATQLVDPHYNPNLKRDSLLAACATSPEGERQPRTDAI